MNSLISLILSKTNQNKKMCMQSKITIAGSSQFWIILYMMSSFIVTLDKIINPLRKILKFHLMLWSGNTVRFHKISTPKKEVQFRYFLILFWSQRLLAHSHMLQERLYSSYLQNISLSISDMQFVNLGQSHRMFFLFLKTQLMKRKFRVNTSFAATPTLLIF